MLRELLASFDIDTSKAQASLKGVNAKMNEAKSALGALAEFYGGKKIAEGFKEFVAGQIEAGSRVNDLSEKLGVGVEELQQFQFAAKLVGVEGEGAAAAIGFLSKNMGLAIEGNKEAVETFTKLGVDIKDAGGNVRELGDVIPDLADAFEGMGSSQERTAAAMKIFGKQGAALIPLLKDGSKGLREMYEEFDRLGGGMSEDFVHDADKAGDEIDKLKFAFNGWKSQLAHAILPLVAQTATRMAGLVGTFRKVTKETDLAKYAMTAMGAASAAASLKSAVGISKLLGIVPKDASFWKSALGLGEIGLVIAGVALLFLVFEDLFQLITGGQSLTGELMTEFFGAEQAAFFADQLRGAWEFIKQTLSDLKPDLNSISDTFAQLGTEALPIMVGVFADLVRLIAAGVVQTTAFLSALVQLPAAIKALDFSGIKKVFDRADDKTFGQGGLLTKSSTLDALDKAGSKPFVATEDGGPGIGRGAAPGTVNANTSITNNIHGVPDAKAAGAAAQQGTAQGMAEAIAAVAVGG